MQESTRLDYLAAMGVVNWVPRHPLAHAAFRLPAQLPELIAEPEPAAQVITRPATTTVPPQPPQPKAAVNAADAIRARIGIGPGKTEQAPAATTDTPMAAPVIVPEVRSAPLEPFFLQLWMAGPCALLIETPEPGLESASPALQLLKDILRAVQLPQVPHLFADFQWPLNRNLQLDRSAAAASLALQAFMQGRLENEAMVSIGCFGTYPRLLLGPDWENLDLSSGSEQLLEALPPAWFAPSLEELMDAPENKAQLWQQLKRIMSRWQVGND